MESDFIVITSSDVLLHGSEVRKDRRARAMKEARELLAKYQDRLDKGESTNDLPKVYF